MMKYGAAVLDYDGYNQMATYPCGHIYAVLTAPKGTRRRARWRCPECD